MKHYTMNLSQSQLNQLKTVYTNFIEVIDQDDIFFVASHNHVTLTAFKNGNLTLEGFDIRSELKSLRTLMDIKDYEAVGSSTVGILDVFGPIVICSTYLSDEDIAFLETYDLRNQSLSAKKIVEIAPIIAKKLTHSIVILKPFKYNELTDSGFNLNKIRALLNNHMVIKTTAKVDRSIPVLLEQFCSTNNYFNYLKDEKLIYRDISFTDKNDLPHLSVIASSIIAKYAFLVEMHRISKKLNTKLKIGNSKDVDDQILDIYHTHGSKVLREVAKCNFKNVTKLNLDF